LVLIPVVFKFIGAVDVWRQLNRRLSHRLIRTGIMLMHNHSSQKLFLLDLFWAGDFGLKRIIVNLNIRFQILVKTRAL
jgi:hypothetical protein